MSLGGRMGSGETRFLQHSMGSDIVAERVGDNDVYRQSVESVLDQRAQRLRGVAHPSRRGHEAVTNHDGARLVRRPEETDGSDGEPGRLLYNHTTSEPYVGVSRRHPGCVRVVLTWEIRVPHLVVPGARGDCLGARYV